MLQKRREAVAGYLFMTPWILGLFCFTLIPMVMSLYYSFTSFDMLNAPVWVGVRNYVQLFTKDAKFMKSLWVTFQFVFIGVPLQLAFSLLLAICFKKDRIGIRFYRASYYLPSLFGGSVAVSVLWRQLFNKTGLINQVLSLFGIVGKNWIATLGDAHCFAGVAVWSDDGHLFGLIETDPGRLLRSGYDRRSWKNTSVFSDYASAIDADGFL